MSLERVRVQLWTNERKSRFTSITVRLAILRRRCSGTLRDLHIFPVLLPWNFSCSLRRVLYSVEEPPPVRGFRTGTLVLRQRQVPKVLTVYIRNLTIRCKRHTATREVNGRDSKVHEFSFLSCHCRFGHSYFPRTSSPIPLLSVMIMSPLDRTLFVPLKIVLRRLRSHASVEVSSPTDTGDFCRSDSSSPRSTVRATFFYKVQKASV